jgi:hypothetical protein
MLLLVKTALMLCGAVVCAALVVGSVAGDGVELWRGAGLYALVVLAFPGFIAFAVSRGWGDQPR